MIKIGIASLNNSDYLYDIRQNILQLVRLLTNDKIVATRLAAVTSQMNRLLLDKGIQPHLSLQIDLNSKPAVLSFIFTTKNQLVIPNFVNAFFDRLTPINSDHHYQLKCDRWLSNPEIVTHMVITEAQAIFAQKSREQLMMEMEEKNTVLQDSLRKIKRMGAELDVAQQLQQMVLPKPEEFNDIEGLDIAGYMEPADEVGGDYYDVLHSDGVVTIGIGDVTGHGLESGILMLMTQTAVRTLQEIGELDPVEFLDTLNRTIFQNVIRMDSEKNLTLAILNYSAGTVSISGQHEETIIVRDGGTIERIDTMDLGLPIGMDHNISDFIDHILVELNSGDGVVLYTDGIPEAFNLDKKQYGMTRLCEVISLNWQYTAHEIKDAIIADVREFIGEQNVFDDITLVILKQE